MLVQVSCVKQVAARQQGRDVAPLRRAAAGRTIRGAYLAVGRDGWTHVAWMGSHAATPKGPQDAAPMLHARRDRVVRAAERGRPLAAELSRPRRPSELHALLAPEPPEALALALAFGASGEVVLTFVSVLRDARLDIAGDDLLAEGVPESPAVGAALAETLRLKLDGDISTRDEQLQTAVALARKAR